MTRVMIVDDSPTDVQNIRSILVKAGHQVLEATGGQDALDRIKTEKPDCVIMDVVMPGLNGFQACRSISQEEATKHIPIILCTTKNQETDKIWAMRQGAKGYVTKPVDGAELLKKITALG